MAGKITKVDIITYALGTGDCLLLKFHKDDGEIFKVMIDSGVWSAKFNDIRPSIKQLKKEAENKVDILIVTHEHKDHIYGFEAARALFTNDFEAQEIWMAWTEDDKDRKVKRWKRDYGERKMALASAIKQIRNRVNQDDFENQFRGLKHSNEMLELRKRQSEVLSGFAEINLSLDSRFNLKEYKGGMEGMRVAKEDIPRQAIRFHRPGTVVDDLLGADGLKFYILGPPDSIWDVRKEESGEVGESYEHSHNNDRNIAFESVLNSYSNRKALLPFESKYTFDSKRSGDFRKLKAIYNEDEWRKIEDEWLFTSASMALRMNSLTNNLSLAIAIEVNNKEVLILPGDAEYGSWQSWHDIDWLHRKDPNGQRLTTENLLNRTVFYKVAHHMSHNGTAKRKGLEMMTNKNLQALVTLDYDVISDGWKNTMPNREILDDLIRKTKGRIVFNNAKGIPYDNSRTLEQRLEEERFRLTKKEEKDWKRNYKPRNRVKAMKGGESKFWHKLTIEF